MATPFASVTFSVYCTPPNGCTPYAWKKTLMPGTGVPDASRTITAGEPTDVPAVPENCVGPTAATLAATFCVIVTWNWTAGSEPTVAVTTFWPMTPFAVNVVRARPAASVWAVVAESEPAAELPSVKLTVAPCTGKPAASTTFTTSGFAAARKTTTLCWSPLTAVSGDQQSVVVFRPAANPFVVKVVDAAGFPVQGATVTFTLGNSAAGSLSATTVQTDAAGLARTTFTANGVIGQNIVTATVGSLDPVNFQVTMTQNVPASVSPVGPTTLSGTVGTVVGAPAVVVRDATGSPVPGVRIFFQAYGLPVNGSVQHGEVLTDANGVASAGDWTLSVEPGENIVAASVNAANLPNNPVYFRATGIAIPPGSTLTPVAGTTPTTAPAGSAVSVAVQAKTPTGTPIAGVTVNFQVTGGGGTIGGQATFSTVTDAGGVARVPAWVLGAGSGTINTLAAVLLNGGGASTVVQVTNQ